MERQGLQKVMNNNNIGKFTREDAYKTLDTINMWINNCDTKASIILGSIGVIATIFLSSDYARIMKRVIENSVVNINFWKIIYIVILFIAIVCCGIGILYFVLCITPNIILNTKSFDAIIKKNKDKDNFDSIMFYGSISLFDYKSYQEKVKIRCDNFDDVMRDLTFQIYSAACICNLKFVRLKKGIIFFLIGLIVCVLQLVIGFYCF